MICLILAAGYATRLYPLTENFPKPLLTVGDKTILDHLTDDLYAGGEISEFVLISNHKFVEHFEKWAKEKPYKITVVDDGTTSNEERLGAVRDIQFAINQLKIADDVLVIAGDNILDFSLNLFVQYAKEKQASAVMRYFEEDVACLRKCGVMEIEEDGLIIDLVEKPQEPKTNWCCPPFYVYMQDDIAQLGRAIEEGCGVDAPGSLVTWMCHNTRVYAFEMPGKRFDIGDLESYEKVQKEYRGIEIV
ncbi:MAG: nucleotidyltransferase family protein [Ruminococcaceae bacterium]|nr:nucleotidyltransferase family protein [Oscillospiraceae bacterium]